MPIDSALLMARSTIKPTVKAITKQKQGWPANSASKPAKNWAHISFRNNQPFIRWELYSSSFFASFLSSQTSFIRVLFFLFRLSYVMPRSQNSQLRDLPTFSILRYNSLTPRIESTLALLGGKSLTRVKNHCQVECLSINLLRKLLADQRIFWSSGDGARVVIKLYKQ